MDENDGRAAFARLEIAGSHAIRVDPMFAKILKPQADLLAVLLHRECIARHFILRC